jgi:hypothetical protein
VRLAVDQPGDDLRLADGQLEALPAHDLDEDRELQLAAALHLPGVGALGRQHPDRDVADQLGVEPVDDLRAVSFLPLRPASGEVLMPIVIEMLGSSMVMTGSGRGSSGRRSSRRW